MTDSERRTVKTWSSYRVTVDSWSGYEAQIKRWWWPFWMQIGVNTNHSAEAAENYCRHHAANGNSVLLLGRLPKVLGSTR